MRVIFCPADTAGCGTYRMLEPARVAAQHGVEVDVRGSLPVLEEHDRYGNPLGRHKINAEGDVLVIQRPVAMGLVDMIPVAQKQGIAVVVEMDDDLSCLHPSHIALDLYTGKRQGAEHCHWKHVARAAQLADMVVCTTQALADRYGQHGRVAVIPNYVPARMCEYPRTSDGKTIGWSGAAHTHPGDLEVTHGGVQFALDDTDWRYFKVGGGAEKSMHGLGLKHRPEQTGPLPLEGYQKALGALDIGIVPLAQSRFNECKSSLKGIEYAALGVPFVASPLPAYVTLEQESGMGLLADSKGKKWKQALRAFMEDPDLAEIGQSYRDVVRADYTYEGNAWRWCEAWEQAIQNRRRRWSK